MTRSTARWTTAIAAAGLLAFPASGWAQTTEPQPPTTTTAQTAQSERDADSPKEHLRKAEKALNEIDTASVSAETRQQISELKQHLNRLERDSGARGNVEWETEVAAIDRMLTQLIGPDMTTGAASTTGTAGAVGTAGTTGDPSLDAMTRGHLEDVRKHVTKFAAAKRGSGADDPSATDPADPMSGTTTPPTEAPPATTTSTQPPTSEPQTAQPPATATTSQAGVEQSTQAGVDQESARQHLTAARNTLSELTQLPAAAQLTGEARTHVAELIANFNELITTDSQWRASYAKLEANLNALVGPEITDEPPATTGTAGAVGTTGAVGAEAEIDPDIKAKLIEFRSHLQKFEEAAGGATAGGAAAASPATGAMTEQSGQQPAQPQHHGQHQQQMTDDEGHREAMRHIEAIEAILSRHQPGTAGTTGTPPAGTPPATGTPPAGTPPATGTAGMADASVTLDSSDLQQLRTHLSELRRLVEKAKDK